MSQLHCVDVQKKLINVFYDYFTIINYFMCITLFYNFAETYYSYASLVLTKEPTNIMGLQ